MNDVVLILLAHTPLGVYILMNYKEGRLVSKGFDEQKWNDAIRRSKSYGSESYRGSIEWLETTPAKAMHGQDSKQRRSFEQTIQ
jgi:hypothetical protein